MEQRHSACPLDCPDLCGLTVTVDGGRVVEVDGDRRGPLTDGFICGKVRKIAEHLYGDDRLLAPLVRAGAKGSGQWRTTSWDEALDLIADRLAVSRAASAARRSCRTLRGSTLADRGRSRRGCFRARASTLARTFCPRDHGGARLYVGCRLRARVLRAARLIVLWSSPVVSSSPLPVIDRPSPPAQLFSSIRGACARRRAELHLATPRTDVRWRSRDPRAVRPRPRRIAASSTPRTRSRLC